MPFNHDYFIAMTISVASHRGLSLEATDLAMLCFNNFNKMLIQIFLTEHRQVNNYFKQSETICLN